MKPRTTHPIPPWSYTPAHSIYDGGQGECNDALSYYTYVVETYGGSPCVYAYHIPKYHASEHTLYNTLCIY